MLIRSISQHWQQQVLDVHSSVMPQLCQQREYGFLQMMRNAIVTSSALPWILLCLCAHKDDTVVACM